MSIASQSSPLAAPVLLDAAPLLDETELPVERDPARVVRKHRQAQLVQAALAGPLDRRGEQRRADATVTPLARHSHPELPVSVAAPAGDASSRSSSAAATATNVPSSVQLAARASTSTGGSVAIPSRSSATAANSTASGRRSSSSAGRITKLAPGAILARSGTIEGVSADVVIRTEQDTDHAAIAAVVRAAFTDNPDQIALLVERIARRSASFPSSRWSPKTIPA